MAILNLQPVLENEKVILSPLKEQDFEALYAVASDPKIWEQHPRKDRWKRENFQKFFDDNLAGSGALKVVDKNTGNIIGSTRFYNFKEEDNSIMIGYTFYAVEYWGKGINRAVKKLMLDYIFQFVSKVYLYTGVDNLRSQFAISKLGAKRIEKQEVAYAGEPPRINYLYCLRKEDHRI